MKKLVLNVGGGGARNLPNHFAGWDQRLLDIDPAVKPDICCDALAMETLPPRAYDALYCSHTLEHFYRHEVPKVLRGFRHVLRRSGFAQIAVPDMTALFAAVAGRDILDTWYVAPAGPISFHDVIYGWGRQVETGNLYYCHKTGFSEKMLTRALKLAGFTVVYAASDGCSLHAFAFSAKPSASVRRALDI